MTCESISSRILFVEEQKIAQEEIESLLDKATALLEVILNSNFLEDPESPREEVTRSYLWTLFDLIDEASQHSKMVLQLWQNRRPLA